MKASGSLRGPKSRVKPEVSTFWCGRKGTAEKGWGYAKETKVRTTLLTEVLKSVVFSHHVTAKIRCFTCVMVSMVACVVGGGRRSGRILLAFSSSLTVSGFSRLSKLFLPLRRSSSWHHVTIDGSACWCLWVGPCGCRACGVFSLPDFSTLLIKVIALKELCGVSLSVYAYVCVFLSNPWEFVSHPVMGVDSLARLGNSISEQNCFNPPTVSISDIKFDQNNKLWLWFLPKISRF